MVQEKKVFVYYLTIKDTRSHRYLTSNQIKELLSEISEFTYTRGEADSQFRELGGVWFVCDVEGGENIFRFIGSKKREDQLPWVRESKEDWTAITQYVPEGSEILEPSYGTFYFTPELTGGCYLFLLKNHHGMSITRIREYIKKCYPHLTAEKTIITEDVNLVDTVRELRDLRYVYLDDKWVLPTRAESRGRNVGDYHDRINNPNDFDSKYLLKRLQIDLREVAGTPYEKLKSVIRDFTGRENISDEEIKDFISESNTHLVAVKQESGGQQKIDLTKDLFAFDYRWNSNRIDREHFHSFCDEKFQDDNIRRKLISLSMGVANVDNNE